MQYYADWYAQHPEHGEHYADYYAQNPEYAHTVRAYYAAHAPVYADHGVAYVDGHHSDYDHAVPAHTLTLDVAHHNEVEGQASNDILSN